MRAALLATTVLCPLAALGQQVDQGTAQMIMSSQQSQVPGGECSSNSPCQTQGLIPITFQQGDVVLQGSITDASGNVWSLSPDNCNNNAPSNWWSGLSMNGAQQWCGYGVALRNVGGDVWYEEAKGSGWKDLTSEVASGSLTGAMSGPYVTDPGQGTAVPQTTSAPTSLTTTSASAPDTPPTSDPNAPCQQANGTTMPGAITPNSGTFTANGNTYSIDATNTDVASINGAPINDGAYETSQLMQGSDGTIYGQSNAAANNGQWFTLQGSGNDTWWQSSPAPPASTSAGSSGSTTMATAPGPVTCPTTPSIQAQISADNQEIHQLMTQQAQLTVQPQTTTTPPAPPTDSTISNGGSQ